MFKNMKIGLRLGLSFGLILAMLAAVGVYAILHVNELNSSIEIVVKDRMVKARQCQSLVNNTNIAARVLRNMILLDDASKIKEEMTRLDELSADNTRIYDSLEATIKSEEGKKLLASTIETRKSYGDSRKLFLDLIQQGKKVEATALIFGDLRTTQTAYIKSTDNLIDFHVQLASKDGEEAANSASSLERILVIVIIGLILFAAIIAWILTRSLTTPIGKCIEIAEKVARGETNVDIQVNSTDETGTLMNAMKHMVEAIQRMTADTNLLVTAAKEGKLAVRADASMHQGDFRKIVQGVNETLDSVIGPLNVSAKYVDDISKGIIPAKITDTYNGDFNLIKNNLNVCIDAVNSLVKDTGALAQAAVEGKLAVRADASKHQGDFRRVVQGVNDTLDSVIGPINVTAKYVDDISKGVIPPIITDNYNGDFNLIKNNLNSVVKMMSELLQESDSLVSAALNGSLSTRANANLFQGGWKQLITGVNSTLDAVLEPINEAAGILDKVAARDMTARVQGNYKGDHTKIKNSLNLAVENLEQALSQVSESTQQVASASGQISSGSQNLAQGANEQASSLEEVSASLEEMSSMTRQNAENATQAKNLSGEADQNAKQGTDAMERMSSSIVKIKESSDQTAKIVKTIDEIAMQTNLLALNAAVEAARAGEAGRGFAVVAEEVRNLAQRSAQAAKNTADMIGESVKNADEGVKISRDVSRSFEQITTSTRKVNDLISEIAAASKEQAAGIKQVNDAVSQMDKVTQQNAANAEESASASEELSSQAAELQAMVSQFNLGKVAARGGPSVAIGHAPKRPAASKPALDAPRKPKVVSADDLIPMHDEILKDF
jgi:methyl-accepting chemotaxis protein